MRSSAEQMQRESRRAVVRPGLDAVVPLGVVCGRGVRRCLRGAFRRGRPPKASVPASSEAYGASVERLRVQREQFAKELARAPEPDAVLARARTALLDAVTTELLPAWSGTPWGMQGTATVPGG